MLGTSILVDRLGLLLQRENAWAVLRRVPDVHGPAGR